MLRLPIALLARRPASLARLNFSAEAAVSHPASSSAAPPPPPAPSARAAAAAAAASAPAPPPPAAASARAQAASAAADSAQPDSVVHISMSTNNTVVSVSTLDGDVVARSSGGALGLRHRARASPAAAADVARAAAARAVERGFKVCHVRMIGPSRARGQALRGVQGAGMRVFDIRDVTPTQTNGCRPPAARRL